MKCLKIGEFWGKGKYSKRILDIKELSNGRYLIKTENSKSKDDFRVKVIFFPGPTSLNDSKTCPLSD